VFSTLLAKVSRGRLTESRTDSSEGLVTETVTVQRKQPGDSSEGSDIEPEDKSLVYVL
jgi:hypothetical protein